MAEGFIKYLTSQTKDCVFQLDNGNQIKFYQGKAIVESEKDWESLEKTFTKDAKGENIGFNALCGETDKVPKYWIKENPLGRLIQAKIKAQKLGIPNYSELDVDDVEFEIRFIERIVDQSGMSPKEIKESSESLYIFAQNYNKDVAETKKLSAKYKSFPLELTKLMEEADGLGLTYPKNIGINTLREKIEKAKNVTV